MVLDEYAKGSLRAAVEEAAQAGADAGGSLSACEAEAAEVRADLLHGPFGAGVRISCSLRGGDVVALASGDLPSLVPPVPSLQVSEVGFSQVQRAPAQ